MAICDFCDLEMLTADSCTHEFIRIDNEWYGRLRYYEGGRCHDCGIKEGGLHHNGCDREQCPVCHRQLISCEHSENAILDNERT